MPLDPLAFYRQAVFLTSAPRLRDCPPDEGREVAFAGRSNAGKSSAINALTGQTRLAHTSKTPGRTRLINFFALDDTRRLVDLPGYGYAKVSRRMREDWQRHLAEYLEARRSLVGLVVVMDIRRPLQPFDDMMLAWAEAGEMPVHLLLTKADKLKRGPANNTRLAVEKVVRDYRQPVTVQLFSALKRTGIDTLATQLDRWLERPAAS